MRSELPEDWGELSTRRTCRARPGFEQMVRLKVVRAHPAMNAAIEEAQGPVQNQSGGARSQASSGSTESLDIISGSGQSH